MGRTARDLHVGTFHSICARVLRSEIETLDFGRARNFTILDEDEQSALIKAALKALNLNEKQYQPRNIQGMISRAKNDLDDAAPSEENATKYIEEIAARVYKRYEEDLRRQNALDFDDLIFLTHQLWRRNSEALLAPNIAITTSTWMSSRTVIARNMSWCACWQWACPTVPDNLRPPPRRPGASLRRGDEDQAHLQLARRQHRERPPVRTDFPERALIVLGRNYRSTQNILEAAMHVVERNPNRKKKQLWTDLGSGALIIEREVPNEKEEGNSLPTRCACSQRRGEAELSDCAVLYRTNAQSRAIEEEFLHAGVPYVVVGSRKFYERKEIRDVIAYLRLVNNPRDIAIAAAHHQCPQPQDWRMPTVNLLLRWAEELDVTPEEAIAKIDEHPTMGTAPKEALKRFGAIMAGLRARRADDATG